MKLVLISLSGSLFGFGLAISGMLDPSKVQAFLNVTQNWDPSLVFVMFGGILTTSIGYFFSLKRSSPLYDTNFHIPVIKHIDKRLISGSILFGIGWGLGGLCPGPAVAILSNSFFPAINFLIAMLIGLYIGKRFIIYVKN